MEKKLKMHASNTFSTIEHMLECTSDTDKQLYELQVQVRFDSLTTEFKETLNYSKHFSTILKDTGTISGYTQSFPSSFYLYCQTTRFAFPSNSRFTVTIIWSKSQFQTIVSLPSTCLKRKVYFCISLAGPVRLTETSNSFQQNALNISTCT